MNKKEWNEGLDHIDSDLVENYVEQKEKLHKTKRSRISRAHFVVAAACFLLIVSTVVAIPTFRKSQLSEIPSWNTAKYSAQEIADIFNKTYLDAATTNSYVKICVPDATYLHINEIPDEEYLSLYRYQKSANKASAEELQNFIDSFLPELTEALDEPMPQQLEIKESDRSYGKSYSSIMNLGPYYLVTAYNQNRLSVSLSNHDTNDRKIILAGEPVQIDQRLSDDDIISSIHPIKNKLFDIFNVSFPDIKINRYFDGYSEHGAYWIEIYFYDNSAHPLNSSQTTPLSDYIFIEFDNSENYSGDIVSDSILTVASIRYRKLQAGGSDGYVFSEKARRISLKEAEALLYKGYVFGGHSCPLCMATQDKISFEDYDFVSFEYSFGYDPQTNEPAVAIPFYVFYKKIGTSQNGNSIYASTRVAAIEVKGYTEYFEKQTEQHKNN